MLVIIGVLTFLAILAVLAALYQSRSGDAESIYDRLNLYTGNKKPDSDDPRPASRAKWRRVLTHLSQYVVDQPTVGSLHIQMQQAGIPLKGSEFLVLSVGLSLIAGLVSFILSGGSLSISLVMGALTYLAFWLDVKRKTANRLSRFNPQLGEALTLMANALRSGFSFLQAVEVISREMPSPIADEFSRFLNETRLGMTTEEGLRNLITRVPSGDLDLVVTSVLIQRQVGGNLTEILDNIGQTIRNRQKMKDEIRTLTAQGRASGWIMGLMPVTLLGILYLLTPDYVGILFTDPLGIMLLGGAFVMQLIGVWIIGRIVSIDA